LEADSPIRECGLFIFENIGEIAGIETKEQSLYGILDWLLENRRKIVISGTVPINDMMILAPRICAQIDGGIDCPVE